MYLNEPLQLTGTKVDKKHEKLKHSVSEKKEVIEPRPSEKKAQPPGVVETPSSPEQRPHLEDGNLAQEIPLLLQSLAKSISSMSQDIGAIRKVFETGMGVQFDAKVSSEDTANSEATIIPLDFEAFLQRRKHI